MSRRVSGPREPAGFQTGKRRVERLPKLEAPTEETHAQQCVQGFDQRVVVGVVSASLGLDRPDEQTVSGVDVTRRRSAAGERRRPRPAAIGHMTGSARRASMSRCGDVAQIPRYVSADVCCLGQPSRARSAALRTQIGGAQQRGHGTDSIATSKDALGGRSRAGRPPPRQARPLLRPDAMPGARAARTRRQRVHDGHRAARRWSPAQRLRLRSADDGTRADGRRYRY